MPTIKPRLNVTLPSDVRTALVQAARRDRVPMATKAARLLELALELEEDTLLDRLATDRDTLTTKYVTHDQAWK